jgi:hypothetical protein
MILTRDPALKSKSKSQQRERIESQLYILLMIQEEADAKVHSATPAASVTRVTSAAPAASTLEQLRRFDELGCFALPVTIRRCVIQLLGLTDRWVVLISFNTGGVRLCD